MSRFSRINTIWRKELADTLRDRRTLIAMVLVPMVLYPALMLGSLQALEVQVSYLVQEEYNIAVAAEDVQLWLRRLIDSDPVRRARAETQPTATMPGLDAQSPTPEPPGRPGRSRRTVTARAGVRQSPPEYKIFVVPDVVRAVIEGRVHTGVVLDGPPPDPDSSSARRVGLVYDETDIRSEIASAGLMGIFERASERIVRQRLADYALTPEFLEPLAVIEHNVASAEKMAGSILGQIVPLILIIMTLTGAIYPAIDLTAGERERGTLETLMVAPVPAADLIAGKFIVVTLIGLLSALLNLLSIGGTIYLGGLGELLTQGSQLVFPLSALPWVLLLLVPLAVMFSAVLLAVCSFARSFKEAQNYIVPVFLAAMIPGVVGVLPGTRLEGPIVVMPVANIVVLTRELFLGRFDLQAILWVLLSTSLYATAAIAVAARLFGQEAVLFADAGSVRTLFQRRFFTPRAAPTAASALLVLAVVYTLNFYVQQALGGPDRLGEVGFLAAVALTLVVLLGLGPLLVAVYLRLHVPSSFHLAAPRPGAIVAALCFGASTWVLATAWLIFQQRWMPLDPWVAQQMAQKLGFWKELAPWHALFFLALVPALVEEWFFRGFVLSGLRGGLNRWTAVLVVALSFGLHHYSAHRLVITTLLGVLLGVLVIQYGSIWPAVLAHLSHNAMSLLAAHPRGLEPVLSSLGLATERGEVPTGWLLAAALLTLAGLLICFLDPQRERSRPHTYQPDSASGVVG
jgi:sodium transport system permease protein